MVCTRCGTGLLEVPDMKLLSGTSLDDRYDIEGVVGTGGMGAVYRARQRGMEREVAIKVLHPHFATDPRAVKRFFREAQSASRLVHPNIVTVFDFGRAREGHLYMVMELLEGWTLGDLIHYRAPLSPGLTIHIGTQICAALEAAEVVRLVHRDLKPDNILLSATDDGFWAKVLDFGIARIARGDGDEDSALRRHESTVEIAGTPAYMAPEQVLGREPAPSSDLYSLGVILYEMVAKRRPFDESSTVALCMRQMNEAPPPVTDHARVSDALAGLIMQLLEKKPENRPASATEVRRRLETCPEASMSFVRPSISADAPRGIAQKTTRSENGRVMAEQTIDLKYLARPHMPLADVLARSRAGMGLVMADRAEALDPQTPPPVPVRGGFVAILAIIAEQARSLADGPGGGLLSALEGRGAEVLREEKLAIVRFRGSDRDGGARRAVEELASLSLETQATALRHNVALRIGISTIHGQDLVRAVDEARRLAADTVPGKVALAAATARNAELSVVSQTSVFMPDGTSLETVVLRDPTALVDSDVLLWGRSMQLRRLGQIADEAQRNGPCQALVLGGRGMGKTSCLQSFLRGRHSLMVRASPLAAGFPGHTVARLVALAWGISRITGKSTDLDPLALVAISEADRGLLETLLLDRAPPETLTSQAIARLAFGAILRYAAGEPLIIAIDDAHEVDTASAAILRDVMLLAAGQPWTFVATARHTEGAVVLANPHRVELKALGLRPMNQLAEEIGIDQRRRHTLLALAQGNPSVLGLLGAADAPADAPISLGEGLLPWLLNKVLRRAGPQEADRAWVEAATGQGRSFETPLVQSARYFLEAGLNAELASWLGKRLAWEGPVPEALASALAASGEIPLSVERCARLGLHRVAAEVLESVVAKEPSKPSWIRLASLHLKAGDSPRAARAFSSFLTASPEAQASPSNPASSAQLLDLVAGFLGASDGAAAARALASAREGLLITVEGGAMRAAPNAEPFELGRYFVLEARVILADLGAKAAAASLGNAQRLQDSLGRNDARAALALGALVQEARAEVAIAADDRESALTNLRQARQAFRDLGRERDSFRCLIAHGALDAVSDDPTDLRRASETLVVASRLALAAGFERDHIYAETILGMCEVDLADLDAGTQRLRVAFRQANTLGVDAALQSLTAVAMARAMARRGLVADARRYLERARQLAAGPLAEAHALIAEARTLEAEGQTRRAQRAYADAAEQARRAGHGVLARVAMSRGAQPAPLAVSA